MNADILDPSRWFRVGTGRRQSLPTLTTEAVVDALPRLPPAYGPYLVVAHELIAGEQGYVSSARIVDPLYLAESVEGGIWQYFVVSSVLSPALIDELPNVDAQTLAISGAINLQIGRTGRLGMESPSLGLVSKVATHDGQTRVHREYESVFESALKLLRPQQ